MKVVPLRILANADAQLYVAREGRARSVKAMVQPESAKEPPPSPRSPLAWSVPHAVRWGYPHVIAAIAVFVIIVGGVFVLARLGLAVDADAAGFVASITAYALVALVVVHASYRRGQRSLRKDFLLAFRPVDLAIGLGIGVMARVLSVLFGIIVIIATGHIPEQGNLVLSPEPLWIVLNGIILASLVAPFVEELLVRGLVLQTVRNSILRRSAEQPAPRSRQTRAVVVSVLVSSLIFSALHLYQSADWVFLLILGVSTFMFGVLNGVSVYLTGRLGSAIVAHIVFNGSSVLLLILLGLAGLAPA